MKPKTSLDELIQRYDMRVPRYTSYPTAPHFQVLEPTDSRQSIYQTLQTLPQAKSGFSLYIHIPYCAEMCTFCGCYTKITKRKEPVDAYITTLLKEIEILSHVLGKKVPLSFIHWGGGSPTLLSADDFRRLIEKLRTHFDVSDEATLSVEIDPRTAEKSYIQALREAGVNRASLGVQDFHPEVLKIINRNQTYEITQQTVQWLLEEGIDEINLDLLYGLPTQSMTRVEQMVEKALTLHPKRVALFGYAHVPWMRPHQKLIPEELLPDAKERLSQFFLAAKILNANGFSSIGLDHFAKKEDPLYQALINRTLGRNFQGYTTDPAKVLLPLGVSSIGQTEDIYFSNILSIREHQRTIERGELPISRMLMLSPDDKKRHDVIMELMCYLSVNPKALYPEEDWHKSYLMLEEMARDDLCQIAADGTVSVEDHRRPFVRIVATAFDAYLGQKGRHSKAL